MDKMTELSATSFRTGSTDYFCGRIIARVLMHYQNKGRYNQAIYPLLRGWRFGPLVTSWDGGDDMILLHHIKASWLQYISAVCVVL